MKRRDMIRSAIVSVLGLSTVAMAKTKKKDIEEERTFTYLENIQVWHEGHVSDFWNDEVCDCKAREFLFTGGGDKEAVLELYKEEGIALVYSPRWMVQKGHLFDILFVKIGDKNWTAIHELKGMKEKLPDCINAVG